MNCLKHCTILSLSLFLFACNPSDAPTQKVKINSKADKQTSVATNTETSNANQTVNFAGSFEKISDKLWVLHGPRELPNPQNKGFMNNPALVKTSAGLVVVDPGSTLQVGEMVLAKIKTVSDEPIVAVFNTHVHGDHWLGNQAIKAVYPKVKIYGHQQMLQEIKEGAGDSWVAQMDSMTEGASKGTKVVAPNKTVNDGDVILVGDTHFKIHHYGIAHTKTDIMIEVVEQSVVFLGDNVLAKRLPRMSDGTFLGNMSSIKLILETNAKIYVPGHGPTGDEKMVKKYLRYITTVYDGAKKAFEEDLDSSDVLAITQKTTADFKDWSGYDDMLGVHGAQAYAEVEASEF